MASRMSWNGEPDASASGCVTSGAFFSVSGYAESSQRVVAPRLMSTLMSIGYRLTTHIDSGFVAPLRCTASGYSAQGAISSGGRLAQLARAPRLHRGCRGFESLIAH